MYDESGDIETVRDVDGDGNDVQVEKRRIDRNLVPCNTDKGCPKGHYDNPQEMTESMTLAYHHYLECRAVGDFPRDPIVRQCASVIRQAEEACDRAERMQEVQMIALGGQVSAAGGSFNAS